MFLSDPGSCPFDFVSQGTDGGTADTASISLHYKASEGSRRQNTEGIDTWGDVMYSVHFG